jgi:hypothetical protein
MKDKRVLGYRLATAVVLVLLAGLAPGGQRAPTLAQATEGGAVLGTPLGTALTYQGRLEKDGSPVDGTCNVRFKLWDGPQGGWQVGPTVTRTGVTLSEGRFTVGDVDFGAQFSGDARWLEVAVQCGADPGYTVLYPRQALTAAPAALSLALPVRAEGVSDGALVVVSNGGMGDGLRVESAGDDGLQVDAAGEDGLQVNAAGADGVLVSAAGSAGLRVNAAGTDGVYVHTAGNPSETIPEPLGRENGLEVAGAEGMGVYVGRADTDALYVRSAGYSGLYVSEAFSAGVFVNTTSYDGVWVDHAARFGMFADTAQEDHEWGFYTPDKIYAGSAQAVAGPSLLVAQNGEGSELRPGEVVAVCGAGAPLNGGDPPTPLVRRAGPGAAVAGIVYARFTAEEWAEPAEHGDPVESRTRLLWRSTEGPAAPGEYLLLVVLGPAQVWATAAAGPIAPGDLLAAADGGQAGRMGAEYRPGMVVGTAMDALDAGRGSGPIWVLVSPR